MRLLVVGAGSTGGYIGGRLAQAGRDVTFLVRQGRAERLRRDGLRIVSPLGDATVEPQLMTADTLDETFDTVLLSVKGFQLDAALDDVEKGPARVGSFVLVSLGMAFAGITAAIPELTYKKSMGKK